MDRARRIGGLAWVAAGVLFGAGWAAAGTVPGAITLTFVVAVLVLAAAVILERTSGGRPGVTWVAGWVVAVLFAADFAGAVADRFGVFGPPGPPGAAGVSWGSWPVFVDYTRVLLHGMPEAVALTAAVGATGVEVALVAMLLAGWQRRWVGKAAAALLTVYLVAMASSVGWSDVARYALPVVIGGALLLSACPSRRPTATPVAATAALAVPRGRWY
jgi:hypothetical protein